MAPSPWYLVHNGHRRMEPLFILGSPNSKPTAAQIPQVDPPRKMFAVIVNQAGRPAGAEQTPVDGGCYLLCVFRARPRIALSRRTHPAAQCSAGPPVAHSLSHTRRTVVDGLPLDASERRRVDCAGK